jgi:hypothetical protein
MFHGRVSFKSYGKPAQMRPGQNVVSLAATHNSLSCTSNVNIQVYSSTAPLTSQDVENCCRLSVSKARCDILCQVATAPAPPGLLTLTKSFCIVETTLCF